ncbi:MAG: DinB family protein [SAR324 cluster bacterium]|nr:DinB family protein [SAR324 cluster bacterium]
MTEDPDGLADLLDLGVKSTPVVSRGNRFVHGLVLSEVADFVGVSLEASTLPPEQLFAKLNIILSKAQSSVRQIPQNKLESKIPDRDRTMKELSNHIFKISQAFLEAASESGLTETTLNAAPAESMKTADDIADAGKTVQQDFQEWAERAGDVDFHKKVGTYYGEQILHELLERTCWHSAQHLRQLMKMLESYQIKPSHPLTDSDLAGLPLPQEVWG